MWRERSAAAAAEAADLSGAEMDGNYPSCYKHVIDLVIGSVGPSLKLSWDFSFFHIGPNSVTRIMWQHFKIEDM